MARKRKVRQFYTVTGPRGGRKVVGTIAPKRERAAALNRAIKEGYKIKKIRMKSAERLAMMAKKKKGRKIIVPGKSVIYTIPRR